MEKINIHEQLHWLWSLVVDDKFEIVEKVNKRNKFDERNGKFIHSYGTQ